jgi:hypothetical protein
MKRIFVNDETDLAKICAQLAREGIAFEAEYVGLRWCITITGY